MAARGDRLSFSACSHCAGEGTRMVTRLPKARVPREHPTHGREPAAEGAQFRRKGPPPQPTRHPCEGCQGRGILPAPADALWPSLGTSAVDLSVAIVGGGIAGLATALALGHRGIDAWVFERDSSFTSRRQGYGLTIQQGGVALRQLGVEMVDGLSPAAHYAFASSGELLGSFGRTALPAVAASARWETGKGAAGEPGVAAIVEAAEACSRQHGRRSAYRPANVVMPRQMLRRKLLDQLPERTVRWGHRLTALTPAGRGALASFEVDGSVDKGHAHVHVDVVVGADGIRSDVRRLLHADGEGTADLTYCGVILAMGLCEWSALAEVHPLLATRATFQSVNGESRIYVMPFTASDGEAQGNVTMWQASWPCTLSAATSLAAEGSDAIKADVIRRYGSWHAPIGELLAATAPATISSYPAFGRTLCTSGRPSREQQPSSPSLWSCTTLVGDSAHAMPPFKAQGSNLALCSAVCLGRALSRVGRGSADLEEELAAFELDVSRRAQEKAIKSFEASVLLHSRAALTHGNMVRADAAAGNQHG